MKPSYKIKISLLFVLASSIVGLNINTAIAQLNKEQISVYSENNKIYLADVSRLEDYEVVRSEGRWSIVRYSKTIIPGWVASQFTSEYNGLTTVTVNKLNLRVRSTTGSPILAGLNRDYQSKTLGKANGFVQVYAPSSTLFAIDRNIVINNSKQNTQTNSNTGWQTFIKPKQSEVVKEDQVKSPFKSPQENGQTSDVIVPSQSVIKSTKNTRNINDVQPQYLLSPGDTISLLVFGEEDLSITGVRIPQSGRVSFPLIGGVDVAGKTTNDVEKIVRAKLSAGYIKNPKLTVIIDTYRPVFIKGAIQNTGSHPYSEGLTVAKIIALAGGATNSARKSGVSISRDGIIVQQAISLDSQYLISSGDVVTVDEELGGAEGSAFYVYLHGEVNRPGEYVFRRGLTVEKAIVLAGGFTLRASRKRISVSRIIDDQEAPSKLKKVELYLPIKPGDIIDVGASWF